ncbi:DUF4145 domain-containing protein [Microbacterium sp.]|uniref:DUF4145 domain-containing protein n=1 Tax=Microbacterium sp. TaxID=51671 RepID=UPI0032425038
MDSFDDSGSRTPGLLKDAFDCPRCGTFSKQQWSELLSQDAYGQWESLPGDLRWRSSVCARCNDAAIWRDDQLVAPHNVISLAQPPHEMMPPEARGLYEEAREVVGISRRAGAALARAALERLLRTIDPTAGRMSLAARIERIIPEVPAPLGQMLTVVRIAGNDSLHVDDDPHDVLVLVLDPGETEAVEMIFEAINDLVEEKIAKPDKVRALYAKIPESLREKVDKVLQEKEVGSV